MVISSTWMQSTEQNKWTITYKHCQLPFHRTDNHSCGKDHTGRTHNPEGSLRHPWRQEDGWHLSIVDVEVPGIHRFPDLPLLPSSIWTSWLLPYRHRSSQKHTLLFKLCTMTLFIKFKTEFKSQKDWHQGTRLVQKQTRAFQAHALKIDRIYCM